MRYQKTVLLGAFLALSAIVSAPAHGQETYGIDPGQTPRMETSLGYTFLHANAPPGQCGCFSANGGYGSIALNTRRGFSIVADFTGMHTNTVGATTQSITIFNYLFGPRYTLRRISGRFLPYGQVLGGGSRESSSYTYVNNLAGAAFSAGGGVTTTLKRHLGWTIVEADWVRSYVPNAQNNLQNDLRVSSGLTFRLGL